MSGPRASSAGKANAASTQAMSTLRVVDGVAHSGVVIRPPIAAVVLANETLRPRPAPHIRRATDPGSAARGIFCVERATGTSDCAAPLLARQDVEGCWKIDASSRGDPGWKRARAFRHCDGAVGETSDGSASSGVPELA